MASNDKPIDSLQIEISASAKSANDAIDKLQGQLDKLSTALESMTGGAGYSNLNKVTSSLNAFSSISIPADLSSNLIQIADSISRFNTAEVSSAIANIPNIAKSLSSLNSELSATPMNFDAKSYSTLLNAISRIAKSDTSKAITNLNQITPALKKFATEMNGMSFTGNVSGLTSLINAISKLGSKTTTNAIANIPVITTELNKMLEVLSKAPAVSNNLLSLTNSLANISSRQSSFSGTTRLFTNSFNGFHSSIKKSIPTFGSLVSAFGKFYASFFIFIRGFKKLASAIESSMDYIETYNYFDAAMDQVSSQLKGDWQQAGYDSAQAYFDAYKEEYKKQATELTRKMTGFNVEADGSLTSTGGISLGMNPDMLLNYQAMYAQMSSSMGVASDYAIKLSDAMTRLGADLASVKNLDFEETYDKIASGLTGAARSVDIFGTNIRDANLQQVLLNNGIDTSIKKLTQNDKALLRSIVLLDSTRYAWADLSDTLEQPANQLRMLSANFETLSRTIGNIFLGSVAKVLPYVNALVISLQKLAQWIIDVFHIELPNITSQATGSLSDLMDDMEDGLDDATGSAKKLKQQLLGIDELNVISSDTSSGSSSSSLADTEAIQKAFDAIYDEYIKAWEDAYARVENASQEHANKLISYFKNREWQQLGKDIADKIENGLSKLNWNSIYKASGNAGSGVAQFLNGLFSPSLFATLGETIAGGFNTAFHYAANFAKDFDWKNAGLSLASMANAFIHSIDEETLAKGISDTIKGGLKMVSTFLKNTDFTALGEKIGTFLKELDWKGILKGTWELIFSALGALLSAYSGAFDAAPIATILITGIVGAIGTANIALPIMKTLASALGSYNNFSQFFGIGKSVGTAVAEGASSTTTLAAVGKSATTFAGHFATILNGALIGYAIGDNFAKAVFGEEWALSNNWDTVIDYVFGGAERAAQESSRVLTQYITDAVNEYNQGLYYVTDQMTISLDTIGIESKYSQEFADFNLQLNQVLTTIGNSKIPMSDYDAILNLLNTDLDYIDSSTRAYVISLSKQYESLDNNTKAFLDNQYGIDMVTDSLTWLEESTLKTKIETEGLTAQYDIHKVKAAEIASGNYTMKASFSELPSEMQKCIEKFEETTGQYTAYRTKASEIASGNYALKASFNELPSEMQKCLEKFEKSNETTSQYKSILEDVNGVTSTSSENANILYQDMDEVSNSFENVSRISETLSSEKLPELKTAIDEVSKSVDENLPNMEVKFATEFGQIKSTIQSFKDWYSESFETLFSKEHIEDITKDMTTTFETVFDNIGKTVQKSINKFIDAINDSFNIEWDDVVVNGQKAVESGAAQLLKIKPIKAYASGGIVSADIFAANENGNAEYIGSFGNRTAVANNDQIVSGISSGVRQAVSDVLVPILEDILGATEECASKEGITEDGILNATLNAARTRNMVSGKPVFNY